MEITQKRILMTVIVGVVLIIAFYIITNAITRYTGFFIVEEPKDNDFDLCLEEQDITLYVNTEDLAKTLKDIQLVNELDNIKIKNCLRDNEECLGRGVASFPTWIINSNKIDRDISFGELTKYSGCNR